MTKTCRFLSFAMAFAIAFCLFSGCSSDGGQKTFTNNYNNFVKDGNVTDAEFNNLVNLIGKSRDGYLVRDLSGEMVKVSDEKSLAECLIARGITGSAEALRSGRELPARLSKMMVYLENSASMKGYSNTGNPKFTAPVIALFNSVPDDVEIETGYIGGVQVAMQLL